MTYLLPVIMDSNSWKRLTSTPFDKGDIPVEYADLRAINVTPVISKTFERTVYSIFNKSCRAKFLTGTSQFVYCTDRSCINALLKMQHTYLAALDKKDFLSCQNVYDGFTLGLLSSNDIFLPPYFPLSLYMNHISGK